MTEKPLSHSISIGILYHGKEFICHYEELEKGKNNAPNNETIYEITSLSKAFTRTLAAKTVIDKKLNVDDKVQKYLMKY
ncbi:serine hydrolase [Flavobacterium collinsii]|uniref:serine hydrolase n=1 Tax=Flavobacterium collinsii TaxID=1114861 RepID=UPI0037567573